MIDFLKKEELPPELLKTEEGKELYNYIELIEDEGAEAYVTVLDGYATILIDDCGSGFFTYPVSISESGSESALIGGIFEFCCENELAPRFIDVPLSGLPALLSGTRHANVDGDGEFFSVDIKNECMLLDYPPELLWEDVYLSEPINKHGEAYKRLILDSEHNAYWGNDLRCEMRDCDGEFFISEANEEFHNGTALTLHATVLSEGGENIFVGEGVLYRFDYKGGCEVAIRVLPEYCGRGYGGMILGGMLEVARSIGLTLAVCNIDKRNTAAIRCFTKALFERKGDCGEDVAHFELIL